MCRAVACGCTSSNSKMRAVNAVLRGTSSHFAPICNLCKLLLHCNSDSLLLVDICGCVFVCSSVLSLLCVFLCMHSKRKSFVCAHTCLFMCLHSCACMLLVIERVRVPRTCVQHHLSDFTIPSLLASFQDTAACEWRQKAAEL